MGAQALNKYTSQMYSQANLNLCMAIYIKSCHPPHHVVATATIQQQQQ
jgi:hypothetical protein